MILFFRLMESELIGDIFQKGKSMYIINEIIKLLEEMDETDIVFLNRIYIMIKKHIDKKHL